MPREADKTTDTPIPQDRDRKLSSMERAVLHAMGENKVLGNADDPAKATYPELWAWMSTVHVGRDRIKTPASLSIRLGPEGVLVSLTDRDLGVGLEVSCASLEMAFAAIEIALQGPNPPIKSWGKKEPNLRKRKNSS
jgi:hypothetical protein